jgi:hypothetical protein
MPRSIRKLLCSFSTDEIVQFNEIRRHVNKRKKNKRPTLSYKEDGCFKRTAVIFLTVIFELAMKKTKLAVCQFRQTDRRFLPTAKLLFNFFNT